MPILYRDDGVWTPEENTAAGSEFLCIKQRSNVIEGDLVVGRYSVLPYYEELEKDIRVRGGKLINSYKEHRYVANFSNWYYDLESLTPKTYFRYSDIPTDYKGSLVLKGETNSRKFKWNTHMFAEDREAAKAVYYKLLEDSLIGQQQIVFREFVEFDTLMLGLNGLPITREFRFFVAYGEILSGGYYWSSAIGDLEERGIKVPSIDEVPLKFLTEVTGAVNSHCPFYVVDVAKTASGEWVVVELNDGQMSGLSENNPMHLYNNLRRVLDEKHKQSKTWWA